MGLQKCIALSKQNQILLDKIKKKKPAYFTNYFNTFVGAPWISGIHTYIANLNPSLVCLNSPHKSLAYMRL